MIMGMANVLSVMSVAIGKYVAMPTFTSGGWVLSSKATAIDANTLKLIPTANYDDSYADLAAQAGQTFMLNYTGDAWLIQFYGNGTTWIGAYDGGNYAPSGTVFTTPAGTFYVRLIASNGTGRATLNFTLPSLKIIG